MRRKILSIDGGGIKGIYAAQILSDIEEECGIKLCDYFDIITGTSTGAIIASGLALGIDAKKILELYIENGKDIFAGYSENKFIKLFNYAKMIFDSKYDNNNLKECLERVFEKKKVGDCKTRLLIPTYNLDTGKIEVFKTSHHVDYIRDYKEKIVDVLLSTTAAPTYLPAYNFYARGRYIDGGVGANNPTTIAIVEAIAKCKWPLEEICVLSIGCTEDYKKFSNEKKVCGRRVLDIINFFMRAENQYSENISRLLLNNDCNRYVRINTIVDKKECALDDVTECSMNNLIKYGRNESKCNMNKIRQIFLNDKKENFIPENQV